MRDMDDTREIELRLNGSEVEAANAAPNYWTPKAPPKSLYKFSPGKLDFALEGLGGRVLKFR